MSINATIIGQFITFAILIWFTMRYVWPPIINNINERDKKIAAGLEAAEQGHQTLIASEKEATSIIASARQEAAHLIEQANFHSAQLIEKAKKDAQVESERIIELAHGEIKREATKARESLKKEMVNLAVLGAEKILQRHLDKHAHQDVLKQVLAEM